MDHTKDKLGRTAFLLVALTTLLCSSALVFAANKRPNILLICVDDLRPELACFGVSYVESPNMVRVMERCFSVQRR